VLQIWKARKAAARDEVAAAERAAKALQGKLDRPDEAFLFERSIDIDTFWDALIIAVAARSGAHRVVSEDLNAGQAIAGITIENPFGERSSMKPARS